MKWSRTAALLAVFGAVVTMGGGTVFAGEVVWWTPNFNEPRARVLVDTFQKANPGTTVKLEITATDGLPQRILTGLQSGAAPDLIDVQHGWVNGYAQNKLVLPLDDVIEDRSDYIPAALDYVTWDGKLWAIPYRIETHAIIYNKGDFKAAGLDPEKPLQTWDELVAAAQKLTRDGRSGFAITGGGEVGNTIFRSLPFIWMNGGDDHLRGRQEGHGQRAGGRRGGDVLYRLPEEGAVAGLDAGERRHRQPSAVHRPQGVDVPVRPVRHRPRSARRTRRSTSA